MEQQKVETLESLRAKALEAEERKAEAWHAVKFAQSRERALYVAARAWDVRRAPGTDKARALIPPAGISERSAHAAALAATAEADALWEKLMLAEGRA